MHEAVPRLLIESIDLTYTGAKGRFTVVAELPGLWIAARLPVTLFDTNLFAFLMQMQAS